MPRTVTYAIFDSDDGSFGVVATMAPDRVYRRDGLATLAEAEAWVEGLRELMAACGAPVVRAPLERVGQPSSTAAADPDRIQPRSFSK